MHHCSKEWARYENIDDELFLRYYQVDPVEVMQRAFEECLRESKDEVSPTPRFSHALP
jgi:protein phosphatase PTC7